MRIVVPFGFYGWGNIGDEATLNGFAQLLKRNGVCALVSAGSRNPAHTGRVEPKFRYFNPSTRDPRRWWAKYWATGHAVVGGTPIGDALGDWPLSELTPLVASIDRWKVPLTFIGVGVEKLHHNKSRDLIANEFAHRVNYWSVRSDRDKQRLIEYQVPPDRITVAADMAWLIDPVTTDFGARKLREMGVKSGRPLIGVCLLNENSVFEKVPEFVAHIAAALDTVVERQGATILFLSNEIRADACFDQAAAKYVASRMRYADHTRLAPGDYHAPRDMMSIVACCSATMSMRYHFCLFSALQGVPFFAIERSAKVTDLCRDLGWVDSAEPAKLDRNNITGAMQRFQQDQTAIRANLRRKSQEMRGRAMNNVIAVNALRERVQR